MKKLFAWKPIAAALAAAGVLTMLAASGLLDAVNLAASDAWYQTGAAPDGNIVIVGIDQQALEEIGPYQQWGRDIMAMTIETLNHSEDCRPAAIGIDVLYIGESAPEADQWLAEAAGAYGNVAVACAATFGTALEEDSSGVYIDDYAITAFDEPFPALQEAASQGCINAMMDVDGVLRHHMLELSLPDQRTVPSLPLVLAMKYQAAAGEPAAIQRPPTNHRNFWYLPFCGPAGTFEEISLASVLSGDVPPEFFAGKIVLIGPYAVGLQDSFFTAVDHAQVMHGVEFQANAVQALLWGDYKTEVGNFPQFVTLFILLLAAFAAFWRRPMKVSTGIWLLLALGWLALCKVLYSRGGLVLHVLWVPLGVTVLYAGCLAVNYITAAMERRQVTSTFKRYVAPEIVNEILQEGASALELGGKMTNIAVLFVDVRGFTTMSEMLEPPQVVEILNRYLTLIANCILQNKGTLDKFVGDAAMAFWGAPLPQDDYIMHAVRAAADMVKGSEALSVELMERYGRTVSFGIGVHVGDAVVGNIGSPERMDYTAIGDTVNTSARLEANAPGGTIYISRAVADALAGRIKTTSLGSTIKLKGKKEGFEILTMDEILE